MINNTNPILPFTPKVFSKTLVMYISDAIKANQMGKLIIPETLDNIKPEKVKSIQAKVDAIQSSLSFARCEDNQYLSTQVASFLAKYIASFANRTYYGQAKKKAIEQLSKLIESSLVNKELLIWTPTDKISWVSQTSEIPLTSPTTPTLNREASRIIK